MPRKRMLTGQRERMRRRDTSSRQGQEDSVAGASSVPSQVSVDSTQDTSPTLDLTNVQSTSNFVAPLAKKTRIMEHVVGTPVSSQASSSRVSVRRDAVAEARAVRQSSRRIQLTAQHMTDIEERMKRVLIAYLERPWPKNEAPTRRRSAGANNMRCGYECDCTSYAQCQQNAAAFTAAISYVKEFKHGIDASPKFKKSSGTHTGVRPTVRCHQNSAFQCAALSSGHRVDYYDSGQFGDCFCAHCGSALLRGEHLKIKSGRQSPCCADGKVHTEQMRAAFEELQQPPVEFMSGLVDCTDVRVREAFLNNIMPLNNTFAFASTHGEKAPDDQMGGRLDTCKYNGQFSFLFSDLVAPRGCRPSFAQVYTLSPEAALNIREQNFDTAMQPHIRAEIMAKLEALMRQNPFGQTFETVGTKVAAVTEQTGEMPHFQIVLLTDRDVKRDALQNRGDVTVIERADAPTAKQVAVVWVQEDGMPPQISGFWVCDKAGKMRELKSGMPQIDPCCFPLLHPVGTLGWRWFLKKRGEQITREEHAQMNMQEVMAQAHAVVLEDDAVDHPQVGTSENVVVEEMPEPEHDLDGDETATVGTSAAQPDDHVEDAVHEEGQFDGRGHTNISERQFYRYRMAIRGSDKAAFHWLWFGRRLAEYFTIAVLNRIERNELDHLKSIQEKKNYRMILAREYIAAMEKGIRQLGPNAKLGRVFLMPQTFAGSRPYYQGKYADLMTMVRHLGAPTWFVTFTGNPKWPEITEALRMRENYVHRPDIVCRVFMDKATEFIKDLTERHQNNGGCDALSAARTTYEVARSSFFTTQHEYKNASADLTRGFEKKKLDLIDQTLGLLKEEAALYAVTKIQCHAKLDLEKKHLQELQTNLKTLKARCTQQSNISAGAFDDISTLAQEIQKQTDSITKLEQVCAQKMRSEYARSQQKRTEIWMAILPAVEEVDSEQDELQTGHFKHLQLLASKMNKSRKDLQQLEAKNLLGGSAVLYEEALVPNAPLSE